MPIVSSKRQITLPIDQCREADIEPGDEYQSFVDNDGYITIVSKKRGAAKGLLKSVKPNKKLSDTDSRQSAIEA